MGSVLPLAGLLGKYSLRIGTLAGGGCLIATGIGLVAPPGMLGGGPDSNGVSLSFGRRAGPYDFLILPLPGGTSGGPP